MTQSPRDSSLDTLLDLDGETFVVDREGQHWVKFRVRRVPPTQDRPHGIDYSLTLHGAKGERLVGFDNAHPVRSISGPSGRRQKTYDHKHRHRTIRPYQYQDAATLLADFWTEVDAVLRERRTKS
ncbi:MAG: DUF6516 family protein [Gammaproteobacteria bacterium]|nr:DUF6516 family protein [Gammaproteobacteria bacterium]